MNNYKTERFKKPFNELTDAGKTRRLNIYEKERQERGTVQTLVRLVRKPSFKDIKDDAKLAVLRVAEYNKEKDTTDFYTVTAYIAKDKDKLLSFYQSLDKGQLVSIEYKESNGYKNVWNIFDRSYADSSKAGAKQPAQPQVTVENSLEP